MKLFWICDLKMEEPISRITLQINIPVLSLSLSLLLLLLGALALLTIKRTYNYESGHKFNDIFIMSNIYSELKWNMYILIQVAFMGRRLTVGGKCDSLRKYYAVWNAVSSRWVLCFDPQFLKGAPTHYLWNTHKKTSGGEHLHPGIGNKNHLILVVTHIQTFTHPASL